MLCRDFADAGEAFDGERREKGVDVFGLDDEEAVGLAPVGGDLGEELVGGDAGGGGEVELVADGVADGAGDFGGGGEAALVFGDVEVGLVEREGLDEVGVAAEDVAGLAGDGAVAEEVGGDEDGVGAEALGAEGGHGGADAEAAGFIGGGADDGAVAAPGDDDGFAAEGGVVALLDRGVEGVHVDVDDLAGGHGGRVAGGFEVQEVDGGAGFRMELWLALPKMDRGHGGAVPSC